MSRFLPRSGLNAPGGGGVEPWAQITTTEQGTSPWDPDALLGVGTSFDGDLFTIAATGAALQRDGIRDNAPRWTVPLSTLWPDFDPSLDRIDVMLYNIAGLPFDVIYHGCFCGVVDNSTSNLAAAEGRLHGLRSFNATNLRTDEIRTTAAGGGDNTPSVITGIMSSVWWAPSAGDPETLSRMLKTTNGVEWTAASSIAQVSANMDRPTSNWRIHLGYARHHATAGTLTFSFRASARRVRTSGVVFP